MVEEIYKEIEKKMKNSIEVLGRELNNIRTGRASISLLDGITVNYYGTPTPLYQLATLSVPESRLITVQPWDASAIKEVEKAILKSNLGLTPTNDGKIIRITVPPLTEERRKELVKVVKKMAEDCKIAIRNVRREGNEVIKSREKEKELSEDEAARSLEKVQKITDDFIKKVDETTARKEKEVMEI